MKYDVRFAGHFDTLFMFTFHESYDKNRYRMSLTLAVIIVVLYTVAEVVSRLICIAYVT